MNGNAKTKAVDKKEDNNRKKKSKKHKRDYENLYLYIQIIITAIAMVSAVMLKTNNSSAFYSVKDNYKVFFTTEMPVESNFSYNSFIQNLTEDIKDKYNAFTQTIAYIYGKGKNDTYPSNISFEKFVPEDKGTAPVSGIITSEFGIRTDPFDKTQKDFHTGLDIAAAKGTFIKAAFGGTVTETGYTDVAGNYIKISDGDQIQCFYGHTQFIFVKEGDKILEGQTIATVGDSGMVTGPHLHFEVLHDGKRVNPMYTFDR